MGISLNGLSRPSGVIATTNKVEKVSLLHSNTRRDSTIFHHVQSLSDHTSVKCGLPHQLPTGQRQNENGTILDRSVSVSVNLTTGHTYTSVKCGLPHQLPSGRRQTRYCTMCMSLSQ
jgi:hypothetical protein